jgi:hypothetical protein
MDYVPFGTTVWNNALPEAIGGGAVAIVLLTMERIRAHFSRRTTLKKARAAALTEVDAIRSAATLAGC